MLGFNMILVRFGLPEQEFNQLFPNRSLYPTRYMTLFGCARTYDAARSCPNYEWV
jgi:hypothetical protein